MTWSEIAAIIVIGLAVLIFMGLGCLWAERAASENRRKIDDRVRAMAASRDDTH